MVPPRDRASRVEGLAAAEFLTSRAGRVTVARPCRIPTGFLAPPRLRRATLLFSSVSARDRLVRPPTPPGFDASRAAERAADPAGWRYPDDVRAAVYRVIGERRDIRRFRPDAVPDDVLQRVLSAAHQAPSVGLMQPWRLIVVRGAATRMKVRRLAQRERLRQADRFDDRARQFLDQKIEGIVEAPLGVVVCCDHGDPDTEVLGRGTIRETDVYSTACAIENLWLAARAEGLGVGWVSFYRPADLRRVLGIPERVDPIAYLCLGWPDERPSRPGLESAGWAARTPLESVVMEERWDEAATAPRPGRTARRRSPRATASTGSSSPRAAWGAGGADRALGGDHRRAAAAGPARRGADLRGRPRPRRARHEPVRRRGVRPGGRRRRPRRDGRRRAGPPRRPHVLVADVGLAGPTPPGLRDAKVAPGQRRHARRARPHPGQVDAALAAGGRLAAELAGARWTASSSARSGSATRPRPPRWPARSPARRPRSAWAAGPGWTPRARPQARGRSPRRSSATARGSAFAQRSRRSAASSSPRSPARSWRPCGARLPVVLDGYATSAAALAAAGIDPAAGEILIASHRSAEPGHDLVLVELGLEPLLDLRLRLGEASGALLALPLVAAAGALCREMATFAEAGVTRS